MVVEARVTQWPDGAVIHDAARLGSDAAREWFDPQWWRAQARLRDSARGRGEVQRVDSGAGPAVLRHYRRGGVAARFSHDAYLYLGRERTRPFREFRALAWARERGLPVPVPLAAAYVRRGPLYRADILTAEIEHAQTLAQLLASDVALPWAAVGTAVGAMHGAGLCHADLNAHNVMVDRTGVVWIIDFDRARRRTPHPAWQQANLRRLHRSLVKLGAAQRIDAFDATQWPALAAAHAQHVAAAG